MLLPVTEFQDSLDPSQTVLILLHGVFGRGKNFGQIARVLSKDVQCMTLDLRNHGTAPPGPLEISAMAKDVIDTCLSLKLEKVILLGHSMGGKVAMSAALETENHPAEWHHILKALIIADIAPISFTSSHRNMASDLARLEFPALKTRRMAADFLLENVPEVTDPAIAAWLTQNLAPGEYPYWETNIAQIALDFDNVANWPKEKNLSPYTKSSLFLRGEKSDYIPTKSEAEIFRLFPKSEIKTIENAGHWLHAEQPQAFLHLVKNFLETQFS
ncbi:alpha/beta fold hydrolase [Acetobacteraceae bacterium]|nr:alpha/beta fold hydrolase [Acetobacteraceae bacterium]